MAQTLDVIFKGLWDQYTESNPQARKIYDLFLQKEGKVVNDHVAFRTFNDPRINIDVLARPFTSNGYEMKGSYVFEEKHLRARHYELPHQPEAPRVFVSELVLEEFSEALRNAVKDLLDAIDSSFFQHEDLVMAGSFPGVPSFNTYQELRSESEYAAWLYVYGLRANHFTISVNHLTRFDGIESVNEFLKRHGFELNSSGGEIKGSSAQLLKQSSTLAENTEIGFQEGRFAIPACYYEFAERFTGPDGKLFSGFIAGSADKIFESTDFKNDPAK